jgi:hypothetical protein
MGVAEHAATNRKMFAFEGEMVGIQGYQVELRNNMFSLTPRTTMPDMGTVCSLLAADPLASTIGPFADGTANMAMIRACNVVPLLNKYAAFFWPTRVDWHPAITSR